MGYTAPASDIDVTGAVTVDQAEYATQIDEAAGSITYVGKAAIGTATSAAAWQVYRMDESGDPELIILWADGDNNFDNIWDNRASLSYS